MSNAHLRSNNTHTMTTVRTFIAVLQVINNHTVIKWSEFEVNLHSLQA